MDMELKFNMYHMIIDICYACKGYNVKIHNYLVFSTGIQQPCDTYVRYIILIKGTPFG